MYDLNKRKIFLKGTVSEVIKALKELPDNCLVHVCGSELVALHVSADGKYCSFDENTELDGEYDDVDVYLVDVGTLLEEDDDQFHNFSNAYDKKYGYFDDNQYYTKDKKQAIEAALGHVKESKGRSYGIVSKFTRPADFDITMGILGDETYLVQDVVYSAAWLNGNLVENFIEKGSEE